MIISHKHKFVFVKTKKTAGTSIQQALDQIVGPDDVVLWNFNQQNAEPFNDPCYGSVSKNGHQSLSEIFRLCPECKDYFVIIPERNCWDKVVSYFHFMHYGYYKFPVEENAHSFQTWLITENPRIGLPTAASYLYDRPDFVIQYHRLAEDWLELQQHLQVTLPALPHRLGNKRPKISYTLYYDEPSIKNVAKIFHREIDMYGYVFGQQDTHWERVTQ